MAEARELLTTWEMLKNKESIDKRLALCDDKFGFNGERRVRECMRKIKKEERMTCENP